MMKTCAGLSGDQVTLMLIFVPQVPEKSQVGPVLPPESSPCELLPLSPLPEVAPDPEPEPVPEPALEPVDALEPDPDPDPDEDPDPKLVASAPTFGEPAPPS
jgi:hypothetical protein